MTLGGEAVSEKKRMTPDQLQWVLEHNMQIRGGHRVQISDAVTAWRAQIQELEHQLARVKQLSEGTSTDYILREFERLEREIARLKEQ